MTPYISPVTPYSRYLHLDCSMSDISLYRIARDAQGSISYYLPDKEVILIIECKDGGLIVVYEKDKWKK